MAVKDDNNQTSMGGAFGSAKESQQNNQQGTQQQEQQRQQHSWRGGLGGIGNMVMNRNPASETLTNLEKHLNEQYAKLSSAASITLLPLDLVNNPSMGLSVLAVCLHLKNAPKLGVAIHTLIVEGSASPFDPVFIKSQSGNSIRVDRTAGEAYDDNMRSVVWNAAAKAFPGVNLHDAGPCVVPRHFDATNTTMVYNLAANAAIACNTVLETSKGSGFQDLSLKNMQTDSSLVARVSFNAPPSVDAVGLPVRGDIVIQFQAGGQQQPGQPIEQARDISEIRGYMDIVYDSKQQPGNIFNPIAPQDNNRQTYQSHFIMTSMLSMDLQTLPAQLMALATVSVLREQNAYALAFKPKPTDDAIDMRDVGAIGLEVGPQDPSTGARAKFDTKSDSFRPEHFGQMMQAFFHSGMMVSLDVPEAGAQTWFNDVFIAAGKGVAAASQAILDKANYLTDGRFGFHYQALGGSGSPVTDSNNRIHNGWFVNRQGQHRDLRDIDYLAVLNLFPNDPMQITQWSNSSLATNIDPAVRLADRWKMLEPLNPVLTGYSRRLTFEPKFLDALLKACVDCKLVMRPVFPQNDLGNSDRVAGGFAQSGMVLTAGHTGMFNGSSFQQQQGNFSFGGGHSRWG